MKKIQIQIMPSMLAQNCVEMYVIDAESNEVIAIHNYIDEEEAYTDEKNVKEYYAHVESKAGTIS